MDDEQVCYMFAVMLHSCHLTCVFLCKAKSLNLLSQEDSAKGMGGGGGRIPYKKDRGPVRNFK